MEESKNKRLKFRSGNLLNKIVIVTILLIVVLNIFRYAAYFEKGKNDEIQISIHDAVNLELSNSVYIDENDVIYLSEEDMKKYFDKDLYYVQIENSKRKYISVFENKVIELVEDENHMFLNDARYKIKGEVTNRDGVYYFPISELTEAYNIKVDYLKDKNRINIDKLSEEKITAVVSKDTNLKYKMTDISKNLGMLKQGDTVEIIEKMDKTWTKIKTSEYMIGYIKSSKLEKEKTEREAVRRDDYSRFDMKNSTIIEVDDSTYPNMNEALSEYDTRKAKIKEILKTAIDEVVQLKGKSIGVKINLTSIDNSENYYRFLKELKAYLNDMNVCLIVVDQGNMETQDLENVSNIIL